MEQYRPFAREALKFLESQSLEVIASTLKRITEQSGISPGVGSHHDATPYGNPDAIAELYDLKYPLGNVGLGEWNQLNRDLWSALVHLTSGEAGKKVDNS